MASPWRAEARRYLSSFFLDLALIAFLPDGIATLSAALTGLRSTAAQIVFRGRILRSHHDLLVFTRLSANADNPLP